MKKIFASMLIVMMYLISVSAYAEAYEEWKDFSEFKLEYFSKLDFFVPEIAKEIPAYERKLLEISETILAKRHSLQTKNDANFLAYTALYVLNTKGGFFAGTVTLDDLDNSQRFSPSNVLKDIHLARHRHVVKLFVESNRIDPKHRLVPYWLEGSQFALALLENREPTGEQVQQLVKQARSNAFGFF